MKTVKDIKAPHWLAMIILPLISRSYFVAGTFRDKDNVTRTWSMTVPIVLSLGELVTSKRFRTSIRENLLKKGEQVVTRLIITNATKLGFLFSSAHCIDTLRQLWHLDKKK